MYDVVLSLSTPQGIVLVYDVTKEKTFTNVSKWLRNIEEVSFLHNLTCNRDCISTLGILTNVPSTAS